MIAMHPVSSSNIAEIGFDENISVLYIRFNNGQLYSYDDVPESVYNDLQPVPSIGRYFHQNIRDIYVTHKL